MLSDEINDKKALKREGKKTSKLDQIS